MERRLILSILAVAALGILGVLLLMPPTLDDGVRRLPWQIEQDALGRTHVFGFTLGETTLREVREVFQQDGKLNLFVGPEPGADYGAEAYFDQIYLQRLRADFVITLEIDQATLAAMYDRGLRISQAGSGSKRIRLDPDDEALLATRPLAAIAYLPKARLDEELIERRFGTPTERRREAATGIVHWLYPERGLDIGRDPKGNLIIQYVNPADFARVADPLATAARLDENQ